MAFIIINCDDFGLSNETNSAISYLFERELITSCSCLVNMPSSAMAANIARGNKFSDKVGLHFNITEGVPLCRELLDLRRVCTERRFHGGFRTEGISAYMGSKILFNFLSPRELRLIKEEFHAQVDEFYTLFNRLPTHIDSHHGSHHDPMLFCFICHWAKSRNIFSVRPQFTIGKQPLYIKTIKRAFNYYARIQLPRQADGFGSAAEFQDHGNRENEILELMVHAIPGQENRINDIDGVDLIKRLRALLSGENNFCSYGDSPR